MADINVFELTNMALKSLDTDKKATKKSVSESVKRTSKKRTMKENKCVPKISFKKLKLESLKTMTEDEDFDFTPDDEVVLVIDTEMEEVPESEEDAVAAAQELVGDTVCKCSVCGANYICTDNVIEEDVDGEVTMVAEEGVCPICGEEAPQIVVGEIVADVEEPVEEPVEDEEPETNDEEVEETETETETETEDGDEEFDETEFTVDEEEEVEEGCNRKRRPAKRENMRKSMTRRPTMRRESMRKPMKRPTRPAARMESAERNVRPSVRRPATRRTAESAMNRPTRRPATRRTAENVMNRPMRRRTAESVIKRPVRRPINRTSRMAMENRRRTSGVAYNFNEVALNKLFTKFATENYSNVKAVRFTKGSLAKNGNMTLEGVVTTVKGNKRPIKLVAEGIKNVKNGKAMLKVRENGPFTEAAVKTRNRVPFVVECAVKGNTVTPVSMKYAFTTTDSGLKESKGNKGSYKVFGSVK